MRCFSRRSIQTDHNLLDIWTPSFSQCQLLTLRGQLHHALDGKGIEPKKKISQKILHTVHSSFLSILNSMLIGDEWVWGDGYPSPAVKHGHKKTGLRRFG